MQGAWQGADASQGGGCESVKASHRVRVTFAAVSARAAFMASIQQPAQLLGVMECCVNFVQQQSRLRQFDKAKQDGGCYAFRPQGARGQAREHVQGGGFAATFLR